MLRNPSPLRPGIALDLTCKDNNGTLHVHQATFFTIKGSDVSLNSKDSTDGSYFISRICLSLFNFFYINR